MHSHHWILLDIWHWNSISCWSCRRCSTYLRLAIVSSFMIKPPHFETFMCCRCKAGASQILSTLEVWTAHTHTHTPQDGAASISDVLLNRLFGQTWPPVRPPIATYIPPKRRHLSWGRTPQWLANNPKTAMRSFHRLASHWVG